jgi:hypothetical protein
MRWAGLAAGIEGRALHKKLFFKNLKAAIN